VEAGLIDSQELLLLLFALSILLALRYCPHCRGYLVVYKGLHTGVGFIAARDSQFNSSTKLSLLHRLSRFVSWTPGLAPFVSSFSFSVCRLEARY
jgi:hypothetical protein